MNQLDLMGKEISRLDKEASSKMWVQYTTGFDFGVTEAGIAVKDYVKDPERYKIVQKALDSETDPIEKRKAKILHSQMKNFHRSDRAKKISDEIDQLRNRLMEIINKFRAQIDGKEVSSTELDKLLSQSSDRSLRQKAYEANLPLNQILVDNGFITLLSLRNELATACGHNNYVEFVLDQGELSPNIFKNWYLICSERVDRYQAKSRQLAQQYLNCEKLMPWDRRYLKNQMCPFNDAQVDMSSFFDLMAKTFLNFGFDITKFNLTYDIFPRKNKSEWGYNFTIEMGKDSRILANVSNRFSDYNVLLHETAHGVHYMSLNPNEPILNMGVSGILSEGFANFFGNQCYSKEFLAEVFNEKSEQAFHEFQKLNSVVHYQSYGMVPDILFDHELYLKDVKSADDIQELRQTTGKQILGEEGYMIPWARLIHHTSHPIYLHNYFLGDVMSENMVKEFSKRFQGKTAEQHPYEFGQFWKSELLIPSGRDPFLKLYENVFNTELSISDYVDKKCLV